MKQCKQCGLREAKLADFGLALYVGGNFFSAACLMKRGVYKGYMGLYVDYKRGDVRII